MHENWDQLTPDQKRERRFAAWLQAEDIRFVSPEAEAAYKARVKRLSAAIQLQTPDRVPVSPFVGFFAADYVGYTPRDVMYDADKAVAARIKATVDFAPDTKMSLNARCGEAMDILGDKTYNWPGHGVADDQPYQFVEGEYMKASEYDAWMHDPSDYWLRTYLPRTSEALAPLATLAPFAGLTGGPSAGIARFGTPEVQAAFEKLFAAGRVALEWQQRIAVADKKLDELGYPSLTGGSSSAPFDHIGDSLRGTREACLDMFRRPDKLLEVIEWVTPARIRAGVQSARMGRSPLVFMPLHKGADGFMSDRQFETFYWPSLLKLIKGLIEEGLVPTFSAQGGYNARLEALARDLPKGKTVWRFDDTDIKRAKEILGDTVCIMGNVSHPMMRVGTPEEVTAYCRDLIETVGKGGGFILTNRGGVDRAKPENMRAMIQCAREYGVYA